MSVGVQLHAWLSDRPLWQQELARRLLTQTDLDEDGLEEMLDLVLADVESDGTDVVQPLRIEEFPDASASVSPRLSSVGSLEAVAAAAVDQTLDFEPHGLTVVYGANGAGKSTYVRVLKRVLRTVDRENVVRGDVYVDSAPGHDNSGATLGILRGDAEEMVRISLDDPPDLGLDTISAFDSSSAEMYLDARNSIAYVPLPIRLLSRMAATQDDLRRRVAELRTTELRTRPAFDDLPAGSEAARRAARISQATDIEELGHLCELAPTESERLAELRGALASARSRNAEADAEAALQDAADAALLGEQIRALAGLLTDHGLSPLRDAARDARVARAASEAAAQEFAGLPADAGSEVWRRMWEAARTYAHEHGDDFPPSEGTLCPLCLRPADPETAELFGSLETHVLSTLGEQAAEAVRRLQELRELADPQRADAIDELATRAIGDKNPALSRLVNEIAGRIRQQLQLAHSDPETATGGHVGSIEVLEELLAWESQRREHAQTLAQSQDPDGRELLEREAEELEGRERLGNRLDDVAEWVTALQRVDRLDAAHTALATNSLTRLQRELSESLVSGALATQLERELASLRCTHLPVDLTPRTSVGNTDVALSLVGAYGAPSVSEILSEGEQRALALAFFLAEVGCAEHDGGLVLDDPVSSLDDERKAHIARRLVEECERRQVVVFTHDLPFMLELCERATDREVHLRVRGMWRQGSVAGLVDESPPFSALRFKQRVGRLTQRAQEWGTLPQAADEDEAWRRVCGFYADMRTTWERGVEERLFRGVVQRFQREVKTQSLAQVDIRPELVEEVVEGMTRCSLFVHDAPAGTRTALPGRAELEEDLERLLAFERATR